MLGILNVGAGDTKLVFDPNDPEGMKRAARIVTDMIRKGFVILAEVGTYERNGKMEPTFRRVHEFDERTFEYVIADDKPEEHDGRSAQEEGSSGEQVNKRGDRRGMQKRVAKKRIPVTGRRGVVVGRSAGG